MAGEKRPREVERPDIRYVIVITLEEFELLTVWTPPAQLERAAEVSLQASPVLETRPRQAHCP
jgi:hypothetical protein